MDSLPKKYEFWWWWLLLARELIQRLTNLNTLFAPPRMLWFGNNTTPKDRKVEGFYLGFIEGYPDFLRCFFSEKIIWLVVSTPLKNISQIGNLPQIRVKIKNIGNHHPVVVLVRVYFITNLQETQKNSFCWAVAFDCQKFGWFCCRVSTPRVGQCQRSAPEISKNKYKLEVQSTKQTGMVFSRKSPTKTPRFPDPEKTWVLEPSNLRGHGVRWDSVPFNFWWTFRMIHVKDSLLPIP